MVELVRDENGILRTPPANARVILFSCSGYRAMCDLLYEQFQSGASIILYRMGEGYARRLVESVSLEDLNRDEILNVFQKLALMAGWGNMHLRILDERTAECIATDSPFVLHRNDVGHVSCFYLSGILSGIASALFKSKFAATEVSCKSSGSPLCRFTISQLRPSSSASQEPSFTHSLLTQKVEDRAEKR
jgi:predicted hydrocarbon binding protein